METLTATQTTAARQPAPRLIWTLVLASLGVFMAALDTLVVTTALPVLRLDLHASLSDLEWTVNAFNLALASFLLTGAALGDRFGRRRMYVVGLVIFTAASAAAALSPNIGFLLAARALQGAGAAIVMPLTLTLITAAFPPDKRSAAIGLWGGITGLAVASGPVVGGAVVGGLSWHWIFWLNVPIGLVLIPLAMTRLRESFGPQPQIDMVGLVLAGAGFLSLTWGLVRANTVGWGTAEVIGTLAGGAALVGLFLAWEQRAPSPMLPLDLFRRRGFATATGVGFLLFAGLFGTLFLIMQFFQTALGYSPLQAGIRVLPWTATPMIVAPIAGILAARFGNRPFMVLGLSMQAIGLGWVAAIAAPGMGYAELVLPFIVAGVGISMSFAVGANAAVGSVPPQQAGVASGAYNALNQFGGVLGVAVLAAVFTHQGGYSSPRVFVDGFSPALWVGAGLTALGVVAALLSPGRLRPHMTAIVGQPAPAFAGDSEEDRVLMAIGRSAQDGAGEPEEGVA
jgi:EmrB/QacA subfamily drug resistance transporter